MHLNVSKLLTVQKCRSCHVLDLFWTRVDLCWMRVRLVLIHVRLVLIRIDLCWYLFIRIDLIKMQTKEKNNEAKGSKRKNKLSMKIFSFI